MNTRNKLYELYVARLDELTEKVESATGLGKSADHYQKSIAAMIHNWQIVSAMDDSQVNKIKVDTRSIELMLFAAAGKNALAAKNVQLQSC